MRRAALLLALCAACRRAEPAPAAWFADVTPTSGVDFVHDAGLSEAKHLPETMGAGGALADLDGDGDLDLYLVQGGPMPAPGARPGTFAYGDEERPVNRLYRNDGRGRFADATAESGAAADRRHGMGVAAGDVDGDGDLDLYLTNLGPDALLLNDGRARFTDATAAAGIADERWTTGAVFLDPDEDGDLDLYVTGYVEVDLAEPPWCGERRPGWRSYCHPDLYDGIADRYWRNRGDGTFEDATFVAGLADNLGKGLCAHASDLDADGHVDLYVANDSTENRLWRGRGNGTFEDQTLLSGTGVDRYGRTEASMGVATGDADGDGRPDLFVTGFDDESDTLYGNRGGCVLEDVTVLAGLESSTRLPVGFGTVLADFDQDGDLDLAVANGHIIDNIHLYHDGKTFAQQALLFENDGRGRFADVSARGGGLTARPLVGRSLLSGDLDGDGDLDLVLTQCGGPALVLRNDVARGAALLVSGLPASAQLVVRTQDGRERLREAGPQPSYLGQCASDVHAGLGGSRAVALRVRVPGGAWEEMALEPPAADERITLRVADGQVLVGRRERLRR